MMPKSMMRTHRVAGFMAVLATVVGVALLAQSVDPHVGTWKLNVQKSTYSPAPGPKSGTTTIEAVGEGEGKKWIVDQQQTDGSTIHWEYTTNLDGKDARVSGNNPNADTIAVTRINATTLQLINKKGGKVTTTQISVVSPDGKTRTVTTSGTNPAGQLVSNVTVFEKQ
jgi:hypothetical protein